MTVPRGWPTLASAHGLMAVVLARAGEHRRGGSRAAVGG